MVGIVRRRLSPCLIAIALATLPAGALPSAASAQLQAPPSVAAEIKSAVGGRIKAFYRERGYWPLWVRDGKLGPEANLFVGLIDQAELDGLDPANYKPKALRKAIEAAADGSSKTLADAELKLSAALADYVRDVRRPPSIKMVYLDKELQPARPTETAVLRAASAAPSLAAYIKGSGWVSPIYVKLRAGLADYHAQWGGLPDVVIPAGTTLRTGDAGNRVRLLRKRLGLPDGARFDKALATRLRAFQAAHGMTADGIAGPGTFAALAQDPAHYEELIELNLERARVLPGPWERHIVVDVAAARLWLYDKGEVKDTMRVIVGKPTEQTPMLAGMMRYAIVNPYWNVPPDLVVRRIAPKVLGGGSLRSMRFEALSDWSQNARPLDQSEVDWHAVAAGSTNLRVRQLPGGTNAMGKMKFMLPNDLGIYLHDTPEKELFKKEQRQFSSGCVRVEDAPRLAKSLFGKPLKATSDKPEQIVYLPQPVPVYLTYLTAAPEKSGIAFRQDLYGRDAPGGRQVAAR